MAHGPWRANNTEEVEKSCVSWSTRNLITSLLQPVTGQGNPAYATSLYFFKSDFNTTLPSIRSLWVFYFWVSKQFLYTLFISPVCYIQCVLIIIIIIIIIISFMQGIYTYISETNYVPREYGVAAILVLLFMVFISSVSVLNLLYFYISTFRSMCVVPNMAVFRSSLTSCFPGMLLTYFLNGFEIVPVALLLLLLLLLLLWLLCRRCYTG